MLPCVNVTWIHMRNRIDVSSRSCLWFFLSSPRTKVEPPEYPWAVVILSNRNSLMLFVDCRWRIMVRFTLQRWISRVHLSINAIALPLIALETKDRRSREPVKGWTRMLEGIRSFMQRYCIPYMATVWVSRKLYELFCSSFIYFFSWKFSRTWNKHWRNLIFIDLECFIIFRFTPPGVI